MESTTYTNTDTDTNGTNSNVNTDTDTNTNGVRFCVEEVIASEMRFAQVSEPNLLIDKFKMINGFVENEISRGYSFQIAVDTHCVGPQWSDARIHSHSSTDRHMGVSPEGPFFFCVGVFVDGV